MTDGLNGNEKYPLCLADNDGDHNLAAEHYRQLAEKAEKAGDLKGFAISAFCEVVEKVSVALVAGNKSIVCCRLNSLKVMGSFLKNVLAADESADAVRWREMNYPCHMITSYFWAGAGMQTLLADDVGRLIDMLVAYVSNPDNAKHKPLAALCSAIVFNNNVLAEEVWDGKVEGELDPLYKATTGLFLARMAPDGIACQYYDEIIKMEGPVHVVRAIAARELARLFSPK